MLPRENRLTAGAGFTAAVRAGRRAGSRTLVIHLAAADVSATVGSVTVGFVVGKQVGGAVARNRVRRRLRHLVRARLHVLPAGAVVVVRALAPSATAASAALAADLDAGLRRLLGEAAVRA